MSEGTQQLPTAELKGSASYLKARRLTTAVLHRQYIFMSECTEQLPLLWSSRMGQKPAVLSDTGDDAAYCVTENRLLLAVLDDHSGALLEDLVH